MASASPTVELAAHAGVAAVLFPLFAAPICILIGSRRASAMIAFIASVFSFLCCAYLLNYVLAGNTISYALGGWGPPLGIEYRIDAANALVMFLISAIAVVVMPYMARSIKFELKQINHTLFYCCFLLCFCGLMGVVATGDAFNIFVFLEISSLSTYVLVACGAERDKRALTAAYDYLIMGTIGATFFVIGIGFLYMATGTLNLADMSARIAELGPNRTIQAGFAFIVVGMGLKAAIYPIHLWLPNAYSYSPSAVSVFLAATATKAAVYVILRFMFTVFQPEFSFEVNTVSFVIIPLAILAMFAASIIAVFQTEVKRLLAYSSVAQIGYMMLGIGLMSKTGVSATLVHMFNHGITKAVLFMAVGAYLLRSGSSFSDRLAGLGRQMPLTSAAFVIGGLSLIGVPGTAGFVSKWVLMQAAFEQNHWWLSLLIVMSSLLAVIYVWKLVEIMYLKPVADDLQHIKEAPITMLVPIWILAFSCIWFGFNTDITLGAANVAADALFAINGGAN